MEGLLFGSGNDANDARHFETSSLNTLPNQRRVPQREVRNPLDKCQGVEGASPKKGVAEMFKFSPREEVAGSRPKTYIREARNKPMFSLDNSDISGSSPACGYFKTTRELNPLAPCYQLQQTEKKPQSPPKFLRDTLNITDIDGARSAVRYHGTVRETNYIDDLPGAKPALKTFTRHLAKDQHDRLFVEDINHYRNFRSERVTNIMTPRYRYDVPPASYFEDHPGTTRETWTIGAVAGSHWQPQKLSRKPEEMYALKSDDIEGAASRTMKVPQADRRPTNYVGDIEGAAPKIPRHIVLAMEAQEGKAKNSPIASPIAPTASRGGGENGPTTPVSHHTSNKDARSAPSSVRISAANGSAHQSANHSANGSPMGSRKASSVHGTPTRETGAEAPVKSARRFLTDLASASVHSPGATTPMSACSQDRKSVARSASIAEGSVHTPQSVHSTPSRGSNRAALVAGGQIISQVANELGTTQSVQGESRRPSVRGSRASSVISSPCRSVGSASKPVVDRRLIDALSGNSRPASTMTN